MRTVGPTVRLRNLANLAESGECVHLLPPTSSTQDVEIATLNAAEVGTVEPGGRSCNGLRGANRVRQTGPR